MKIFSYVRQMTPCLYDRPLKSHFESITEKISHKMSENTFYCHFHCETCDIYWNVTAENVVESSFGNCKRAGKRVFVVSRVNKIISTYGNHMKK